MIRLFFSLCFCCLSTILLFQPGQILKAHAKDEKSKSTSKSSKKSKKGKGAQSDLIQDLLAQIAELELQLSNSISSDESEELIKQTLIAEYGLADWAAPSLPEDQSLGSISNAGGAQIYEAASWPIYYEYIPSLVSTFSMLGVILLYVICKVIFSSFQKLETNLKMLHLLPHHLLLMKIHLI
jgi:hypothetical protein